MIGAAAVGMALANGGPTTGHQAAAWVVTAAGPSLEDEGGDSAEPAHQIPQRKNKAGVLKLWLPRLQAASGFPESHLPSSPAHTRGTGSNRGTALLRADAKGAIFVKVNLQKKKNLHYLDYLGS